VVEQDARLRGIDRPPTRASQAETVGIDGFRSVAPGIRSNRRWNWSSICLGWNCLVGRWVSPSWGRTFWERGPEKWFGWLAQNIRIEKTASGW